MLAGAGWRVVRLPAGASLGERVAGRRNSAEDSAANRRSCNETSSCGGRGHGERSRSRSTHSSRAAPGSGPSLGAILIVTGIGVLAGPTYTLARLAGTAGPGPSGRWLYLTVVFTGDEAWAEVVPTKDSVAASGRTAGAGFDDIQRFAAPVPDNAGIVLLTAVASA